VLRGKNRSGEEKERKWRLAGGMWVWSVGSDGFGV